MPKHSLCVYCLFALIAAGSPMGQRAHAQTDTASPGVALTSPYTTPVQNEQFLNVIAAQVLLFLEYESHHTGEARIGQIQGMASLRHFRRHFPGNIARTVELGLLRHPEGNDDIYIYGREIYPDGSFVPNPDLPYIQYSVQNLVQNIQTRRQAAGPEDLSYQLFHLSYVQSDRAIALLKSLGYTTIEYTEAAGETIYTRVFSPYQNGEWKLPVVVKLIDAAKTSLMDPSPVGQYQQQHYSAVPDIGGTFLHNTTAGEPQQRLLVVYNKNDPEPMERLMSLLRNKIDRPARQIVIEALVIEVNTSKFQELGLNLRAADSHYDASFEQATDGSNLPFTFTFNRKGFSDILFFRSSINALIEKGDAEILSSPSVLVLDGRQARIQVGQQVPVVKSTSTTAGIISSVEYFPVGIVLNLRPRISEDGSEVTMQVETIVSAVSQTAGGAQNQFFVAPTVDNRQVQTFVRVADNTPFIIGGLISTDTRERSAGIPILSNIPILGLPFKRRTSENVKKEVIVVLTPHVMPLDEKNFSYVIPKDSDIFNSFDHLLFRNAYRVRDDDVFDLKFIYESEFFQNLLARIHTQVQNNPVLRTGEPYKSLLDGAVPGEEILVRRMLWEVIYKTGFANYIEDDRIIVFEDRPDAPDSSGFRTAFTNRLLAQRTANNQNTLVLTFDARFKGSPEHPFAQPKASINYETLASSEAYVARLMASNQRQADGIPNKWTVLLSDVRPSGVRGATSLEVLKGVLVLKRILALNQTLPLTVKEFRVGRQIIFPTEHDLQQRYHVVDRDAAQFFYEAVQYYPEFEKAFNLETQRILQEITGQ